MENLVPLGTGNSRLMKSNIPASTTLAQLIQMLNNGTFPYDIGPLNPAGISQQGTPLNKATLFSDQTMAKYPSGIEDPDGAFEKLANATLYQAYEQSITDINGNTLLALPAAQVYTGSYTGTNTHGADNPNTLTFPFAPKFWGIYAMNGTALNMSVNPLIPWGVNDYIRWTPLGYTNLNTVEIRATFSGNTVSWYSPATAANQNNSKGGTYSYFALA